ncbi:MAG: M15 family metallopeptidase [Niabella sp.]
MPVLKHTTLSVILTCMVSITVLYGQSATLYVEHSYKKYREMIADRPEMQMIELKRIIPTVVYDLRYATENNFMHRLMYPANTNTAFLRKPAAEALLKVQQELDKEGLGIKIFDAYRPYAVSKKFWKLVQDERYVAHPARGSNHNRGTAVDLTLIDLKTGKELNMGTGFDNFTDSAHHSFKHLPPEILANRNRLRMAMNRYGFTELETEWWHYTFKSPVKFDVLDIPFKKLAK